jgi:tetratricopeptide (TPR) repeat protein
MDAEKLYAKATTAIRARQLDDARRLLFEAVRLDPRHERAWLALAAILTEMDQVIDCLQRVLSLNPNNHTAQEWLDLARQERARQGAVSELNADPVLAEIYVDEPGDEDRPTPRLGKYLLDYHFISAEQLKEALRAQRQAALDGHIRRLGDVLLEQQAISQERLEFALREQSRQFYNFIDD